MRKTIKNKLLKNDVHFFNSLPEMPCVICQNITLGKAYLSIDINNKPELILYNICFNCYVTKIDLKSELKRYFLRDYI